MLGLVRGAVAGLRRVLGEALVSASVVGSAAYRARRGAAVDPRDLDLLLVVEAGAVTGGMLAAVRDVVASHCPGCVVYAASSTYCHSLLGRPSVYVMVYTVGEYAGRVSRLVRASWAELSLPLYGPGPGELSDPAITVGDVLGDAYGIRGCLEALRRGVYEAKPSVLGPGDREPRRVAVKLAGPAEERFSEYCWRWQAYNAVKALGARADPYSGAELARAVRELTGLEWPAVPPRSGHATARLLEGLAEKLVGRGRSR